MTKREKIGHIAVVSGGASGLGQAIAVRLARDGADVVIADVAPAEETVAAVKALGRRAMAVQCDVSSLESVRTLAEKAKSLGNCDILINNAGIYPLCSFEDMTFDEWRRVLAINLDGMFLMAKAFVPEMKRSGWGRIVNVSSHTVGLMAPGAAHYITSKAAVIGFTRALASELGASEITVNAVAPGLTRTPGTTKSPSTALGDTETLFAQARERQAIKRTVLPPDVAGTVSFLASNEAAFITGQTIVIDGGLWRI
jgi:NAD(P)-dependent dehydrogenase (short-subunit alcohol dehydrogenase family)